MHKLAFHIDWQLRQEGINPSSVATINRILKRNNLIRKWEKYVPKGVEYPYLKVTRNNDSHQLDVIDSRYLKIRIPTIILKDFGLLPSAGFTSTWIFPNLILLSL